MREICNCENPVKGMYVCWTCGFPVSKQPTSDMPNQKKIGGEFVVLRSTGKDTEVRAYTVNSQRTAEKLAEDFSVLGFNCKIIDVDDECMRA